METERGLGRRGRDRAGGAEVKVLRFAGYVGWFFFCFFVGVVVTAPLDGFKPLITQRLELVLGKGKQGEHGVAPVATIDTLKVSGLGIKAKRIHMQLMSTEPEPGPDVDVDDAWISFRSLISFASSEKMVDASGHAYGGAFSLTAHLDEKQNPTDVSAEIDDVDLGKISIVMAKLGLPIEGRVHADIDLELGKQAEKDAEGHIDLDVKGLAVGVGKLRPSLGGFEIAEPIRLGDLKGRVPVKQGQGTIDQLSLEGATDVEAEVTGTLSIKSKVELSRLDADGSFKPLPAFLEKNPLLKSGIELGEKLGPLGKAKDDEGRYHFSAKGPLAALNPQLARDGGKKAKSKGSKGTPTPIAPPPPPTPEDAPKPE